jgi:F-type H+-transporting ATPase subunit beta
MDRVVPLGKIVAVKGAVVDVSFEGPLPPIDTALIVQWDRPETLMLEVQGHADARTVRAVALQSTSGLARGTAVLATGAPVSVPVGEAVLGRLIDVVGTAAR